MTGLRERQKADRHRRILAAAVTRFQRDGYHSVRIEDLAEDAEVSVGTVYNYYGTKGDLLMATVALEVEEVLAAGEAILLAPPAEPQEALLGLIWQYYDHSLEYLSKEMWRAAMALSIEEPHTPNGRRYADLDGRLADQVARLVARLQSRGRVAPDLDHRAMGELIFNTLNAMFIEFVKDDGMTLDTLKARVAAQIRPLARLMEAPA
nr:TetR/AcrR family transcriptional regulator [Rubellimicrobium arenae]